MDGWTQEQFTITDCYSTGDIVSTSSRVGGIVGYIGAIYSDILLDRCYSISNLEGSSEIGGILGMNNDATEDNTAITNCIAFNNSIQAENATNVNSISGNTDTITYSSIYVNENMVITNQAGGISGTAISVENFIDKDWYSTNLPTWEFDADTNKDGIYWSVDVGKNRPVLYYKPLGSNVYIQLGNDDGLIE